MIGLSEVIIILVIFGLIALFGRKAIMKIIKDAYSVKKEVEDMQKGEEKKE